MEGSTTVDERGQKREKDRIHIVRQTCHQGCSGGEVDCGAYIHGLSIGLLGLLKGQPNSIEPTIINGLPRSLWIRERGWSQNVLV